MTDLTNTQASLFEVPTDFSDLLLIKDVYDLKNDQHKVYLVRTKADWREKLRVICIKQDPTLAEDVNRLKEKMSSPSPVDKWESGIIYLVREVDGVATAQVISRMDDFTPKLTPPASLLEETLNHELSMNAETRFRKWYAGTTVRVTTFVIDEMQISIYSTRSKVQAAFSRWSNEAGSPTIIEEFHNACKVQGIKKADIEIPGITFSFILQSKWSVSMEEVEAPRLILFRSYRFDEESYEESPVEVPGAFPVEILNVKEAVKYIESGGIVMTMFSFENKKVMTSLTDMRYSWLNTDDAATPDERYFGLLMKNALEAKQYRAMLKGPKKLVLEASLKNLDTNVENCGKYLQYCVGEAIKMKRVAGKGEKIQLHKNDFIANVIRRVMKKHSEERNQDKAEPLKGRGKPKQKGKFKQSGKSKAVQDAEQLAFINSILQEYRDKTPVKLIKLIRECAKLKKTDLARLKKQQEQMKNASSPVTPTFGLKAQKETEESIKALDSIEMFLPFQFDDEEGLMVKPKGREEGSLGVWVRNDIGDESPRVFSPNNFSDDE